MKQQYSLGSVKERETKMGCNRSKPKPEDFDSALSRKSDEHFTVLAPRQCDEGMDINLTQNTQPLELARAVDNAPGSSSDGISVKTTTILMSKEETPEPCGPLNTQPGKYHVSFTKDDNVVDIGETVDVAGDKLVLMLFFDGQAETSRTMKDSFEAMVCKHPEVLFLLADVTKNNESAEALDIKATPTLIMLRNNQEVDRILHNDVEEIEEKIYMHKPKQET